MLWWRPQLARFFYLEEGWALVGPQVLGPVVLGLVVLGPEVLGHEHQALRRRVKRSSHETQVQVALPENQQSLSCLR